MRTIAQALADRVFPEVVAPQQVGEGADLAEGLLEVVRGDVGELLQLAVALQQRRVRPFERLLGTLAFGDLGPEAFVRLRQRRRAFGHALFERLVQLLELLLGTLAFGQLAPGGVEEARVFDGDGGLVCDAADDAFGALGEDGRLAVPEEEAAQHVARARDDGRRQVAPHR